MEDPGSQTIHLQILLLLLLTLLNAFFSASEMALVSLNRSRVEQKAAEGEKKFIRLLNVLENPNHFLSTIQVGITFIGILSGASLASDLGAVFAGWLGNSATAKTGGYWIALTLLTFISIVLGELYPKRIAMNMKENLAVISAPIILFLGKIVSPFVWLLSAATNLISRVTPMQFDDADEKMTRDEIEYILTTQSEETLDADEIEMLQGIFSLDEMMAREVMVPRTDAFMVDIEEDTATIMAEILKQNFSRIPVYDGDKDNVIGLIHTKKILAEGFANGFENMNIRRILQEPLFVPETIFVDDLLKALRNTQNQMAILLDEYGGVAGIVTLEDLLEEIVGEIDDETDKTEVFVREIAEHTYIVQGNMTLNDFNEHFGTELDSDDVDTIAGFYLTGLGTIPSQEEKEAYEVDNHGYHLVMINDKVKNGRVTKLKILLTPLAVEEETKDKKEKKD
ncbi:hemolysin family protein [Streptococcus acidominimus]|uniref:Hemolysin n=1 Tax=Streptococcus acidominimus TaxID=1326 RepID=A0A1Q8ECZ8_STRAI|nr:hemolysin family protein [Streptococcus acidominimus]MBF0847905.1 HlyC/CorC family transporter [Streptococcus danieliae]MBF0819255.1 HlyC/CorC family transporter [Streptococcus acidominimus]MBF0839491.1 HlyC/CorC family transporter [Streptococcus acidominimus]OLF49667.1 hemolysin [Streptococcus acidominimus]TFU30179.1 HlyC/CorC family transporter [Streptococcus acidominimus]